MFVCLCTDASISVDRRRVGDGALAMGTHIAVALVASAFVFMGLIGAHAPDTAR